ncbi:hypothetical protein FRC02_000417 [Tulasnella sp. 418]|nr:hypothetical protein FRC02_000417 [Tulasnella sp. 418]
MSTQQVHSQNDTSPSVPQQKTSQHQWTSRSYIKTKETPLPGEIILLQYPMEIVKFPYGPTSQLAPSSSRPSLRLKSRKSKSSASNPTRFRATPHHVLVLRVLHDQQNKLIRLRFLPIFSYSKPPRGMNGFSWDPAQWMSEQASYASRLHHVPVPAEGWTSPPSPSSLAPALSFGSWMNNRPSWLAMVDVRHPISEEQEVIALSFVSFYVAYNCILSGSVIAMALLSLMEAEVVYSNFINISTTFPTCSVVDPRGLSPHPHRKSKSTL